MAYRFAEKRRTVQEEMAYIVYMIVGSYFNKAICINHAMATRLYLYYAEMKTATQEAKEQKVIRQADRTFESYEKVLGCMNCEVLIVFREGRYVLDFITGFERVHAEVDRKGKCEIQLFKETLIKAFPAPDLSAKRCFPLQIRANPAEHLRKC